MWNDEDNNPYGSFDRRDSATSPTLNPTLPTSPPAGIVTGTLMMNLTDEMSPL